MRLQQVQVLRPTGEDGMLAFPACPLHTPCTPLPTLAQLLLLGQVHSRCHNHAAPPTSRTLATAKPSKPSGRSLW